MRVYTVVSLLILGCSPQNVGSNLSPVDAGVGVSLDSGPSADASEPMDAAITDSSAAADAGSTPGGDTGVATGVDCPDVIACAWGCDDGDQDCVLGCMRQADPEIRTAMRRALECSNENRCEDVNCMTANCRETWAVCTDEDPGGGGGEGSCEEGLG
jgi:hypothetical protein